MAGEVAAAAGAAGEAAAHGGGGVDVLSVVVLLAAAVIAVPVFRRIGLGSVLGYLAAGLAIGPFGLGFFDDPERIIGIAELGVVLSFGRISVSASAVTIAGRQWQGCIGVGINIGKR